MMDKTKNRVCQLTSRHFVDDERILHRMALSLQQNGFTSALIGIFGKSSNYKGVKIQTIADDTGYQGIINRIKNLFQLVHYAARSSYSVFQIHDPDLMLVSPLLKLRGKRIIYDVHDDYEASIKDLLKGQTVAAGIASKFWWFFEHLACCFYDGVVVADRHLAHKFAWKKPVILGNYPWLNFTPPADNSKETTFNIIYVGGVSHARGIDKVIDAIDLLPFDDIRFHIVGECRDEELLERIRQHSRVKCFGRIAWIDLHQYYMQAHMGVALYQPLASFLYYPGENSVKIIEYMAAGIPTLTSNFPGLVEFVEKPGYGATVDPESPDAIAEKISLYYNNREVCQQYGQRARKAFENEYNWETQEHRLLKLYRQILGHDSPTGDNSK